MILVLYYVLTFLVLAMFFGMFYAAFYYLFIYVFRFTGKEKNIEEENPAIIKPRFFLRRRGTRLEWKAEHNRDLDSKNINDFTTDDLDKKKQDTNLKNEKFEDKDLNNKK